MWAQGNITMLRCIAYIQHYIIIAKSTLEFTLDAYMCLLCN